MFALNSKAPRPLFRRTCAWSVADRHRLRPDGGIDLGISEGSVSEDLRNEYFSRAGQARQKQRKTNRTEEVTAEREAFPALFLPDSSHADLGAVSCATHKEDSSQLMLTKTAGVLCVCLSSGIIILNAGDLRQRVSFSAVFLPGRRKGCGARSCPAGPR